MRPRALLVAMAALAVAPAAASAKLEAAGLAIGFREGGVRPHRTVSFRASARAAAVYRCVTVSGHAPASDQFRAVSRARVRAVAGRAANRRGVIRSRLIVTPPAPALECPAGLDIRLVRISYSRIQVRDL